MVNIELTPGGADVPVTEDNKKDYVEAIVEYRISKRVKEQFEAFMSGFSELIPQDLITVFDERELELLIGGMSEIDVYVHSFRARSCADLRIVMIGPSLRTTVAMKLTTRLSSGSGSVFAAGRRSASPVCCSSRPARPESQSTDSRTCKVRMARVGSRLRSLATHRSCQRVIPASTVSTCRRTRTMQAWSRS